MIVLFVGGAQASGVVTRFGVPIPGTFIFATDTRIVALDLVVPAQQDEPNLRFLA